MALGDVYELKLRYRDFDLKEFENVHFYRWEIILVLLPGETGAQVLAEKWFEQIFPSIRGQHYTSMAFYEIACRNLFDDDDAYTKSFNLAGNRVSATGDAMPTFNTVKVTLNHDKASIRKGRKMYSVLGENDQAGGLLTAPAQISAAILAAANSVSVRGNFLVTDNTWQPVVVKRIKEVAPGVSPQYRLPNAIGEAIVGFIQNAVASNIVTTQNSRKD